MPGSTRLNTCCEVQIMCYYKLCRLHALFPLRLIHQFIPQNEHVYVQVSITNHYSKQNTGHVLSNNGLCLYTACAYMLLSFVLAVKLIPTGFNFTKLHALKMPLCTLDMLVICLVQLAIKIILAIEVLEVFCIPHTVKH